MKKASYKFGVEWIALNDDPMVMGIEDAQVMISVCLLADLFSLPTSRVAIDVIDYRLKEMEKVV